MVEMCNHNYSLLSSNLQSKIQLIIIWNDKNCLKQAKMIFPSCSRIHLGKTWEFQKNIKSSNKHVWPTPPCKHVMFSRTFKPGEMRLIIVKVMWKRNWWNAWWNGNKKCDEDSARAPINYYATMSRGAQLHVMQLERSSFKQFIQELFCSRYAKIRMQRTNFGSLLSNKHDGQINFRLIFAKEQAPLKDWGQRWLSLHAGHCVHGDQANWCKLVSQLIYKSASYETPGARSFPLTKFSTTHCPIDNPEW